MPKEITLRLGSRGDHITVDLLVQTLEGTIDMLRALDQKLSARGEPLRWEIVRASKRSPLTITLAPEIDNGEAEVVTKRGERVARAYFTGMREINRGASVPRYFDEDMLLLAKKSLQATTTTKLRIAVAGEGNVDATPHTVENIDQAVSKARLYQDLSSVEGRLETISTHGRDYFVIWDLLTSQRIECAATPELLEQAKVALRKRVSVTGRVHYRNDRPVSMQAESVHVLKDTAPQPSDIGKVDITGGVSSEEYVRRLRNAQ